jgi:hypothetical protein
MPFDPYKKATLTAVVPIETKKKFQKLARKKRWSVSNYLSFLIEQEIKNNLHNSEN